MEGIMNIRKSMVSILVITIILTSSLPVTEVLANSNPNEKETTDPQQDNALSYDNNGNLLNDLRNNYTYDINNRLIKLDNSEINRTTTFTYGPLGNRVTTTHNGNTTHHIYQGTNIIQDRNTDGTASLREFIPDLAMIDYTDLGDQPEETSEVLYYLQDVLGSTIALTDEQGIIVEYYAYEPYGKTIITDNQNNPLPTSAYGNPYMWTGQHYNPDYDLYLFPARTYSIDLGRFIQQDPLGYIDGMNLYEYTNSNPINYIDPFGTYGYGIFNNQQNYMLGSYEDTVVDAENGIVKGVGNAGKNLAVGIYNLVVHPVQTVESIKDSYRFYHTDLGLNWFDSIRCIVGSPLMGFFDAYEGTDMFGDPLNTEERWARGTESTVNVALSIGVGIGTLKWLKGGGISRLGNRIGNTGRNIGYSFKHPIRTLKQLHPRNIYDGYLRKTKTELEYLIDDVKDPHITLNIESCSLKRLGPLGKRLQQAEILAKQLMQRTRTPEMKVFVWTDDLPISIAGRVESWLMKQGYKQFYLSPDMGLVRNLARELSDAVGLGRQVPIALEESFWQSIFYKTLRSEGPRRFSFSHVNNPP